MRLSQSKPARRKRDDFDRESTHSCCSIEPRPRRARAREPRTRCLCGCALAHARRLRPRPPTRRAPCSLTMRVRRNNAFAPVRAAMHVRARQHQPSRESRLDTADAVRSVRPLHSRLRHPRYARAAHIRRCSVSWSRILAAHWLLSKYFIHPWRIEHLAAVQVVLLFDCFSLNTLDVCLVAQPAGLLVRSRSKVRCTDLIGRRRRVRSWSELASWTPDRQTAPRV